MNPLTLDQAKLERQLSGVIDASMNIVATYGLKVLGALILLVLGWLAAGFVNRAILRAFGRFSRIDQTVITFTASTAKYAVLAFTVVAVLSSVGVQTASFVAVLGALGLAIGLALQGTLSHVASGFMLVMFRPFKVGDFIEAAGVSGTVKAITLFTTELATADNIRVVMPNGAVWGGIIKNFSAHATRRADFEIAIAHINNIEKALELARGVIEAEPRVNQTPAPSVSVARVSETAVVLSIQAWTSTAEIVNVRAALNKSIKDVFTAHNIVFPGPSTLPRP